MNDAVIDSWNDMLLDAAQQGLDTAHDNLNGHELREAIECIMHNFNTLVIEGDTDYEC